MKIKFLKKLIESSGYKLFDKNLVKNQRLIGKKSVFDMNLCLENIFKKNKIKSLMQIGANDGSRFDNINKFIKEFDVNGVLVEPVPYYFDQLKETYSNEKNLILENCAISEKSGEINIYFVKKEFLNNYDEHVRGINSLDRNHLIKHNIKSAHIYEQKVKSLCIKDLIKKNHIKYLDLLVIDAEGYDGNIVIDFLKNIEFKPILIFEFIHIKHTIFSEVIKNLDEKKYKYFQLNENLICFTDEQIFL